MAFQKLLFKFMSHLKMYIKANVLKAETNLLTIIIIEYRLNILYPPNYIPMHKLISPTFAF